MSSMNEKHPKPTYWRSLAELDNDPKFQKMLENEFAEPLEGPDMAPGTPARRRFLQIMGASIALSGCRFKEDKLLAFSRRPEGVVPGESRQFATAVELNGVATGLLVTSYDGRPIKVTGNPLHPTSAGGASAFHQAAVLSVYDPDRSEGVTHLEGRARTASTRKKFEEFLVSERARWQANGSKFRVLASVSSSPSLASLRDRLLASFPGAKWVEYSAVETDNPEAGTALCFGKQHRAVYQLENARVVLSVHSDAAGATDPSGVIASRGLAQGRVPEGKPMSRVYAVESSLSLIGGIADHRLSMPACSAKAFLAALDAEVSKLLGEAGKGAQPVPSAKSLQAPATQKFIATLAKDLVANRGASVILAGNHLPAEAHAIAHRLNVLLDGVGKTVTYQELPLRERRSEALSGLLRDIAANAVETLVIIGENPVLTAPSDADFAGALSKVKTSIALTEFADETARLCTWHIPQAHALEAWGDGLAHDGTLTLSQPLIEPLHGGLSAIEFLALLVNDIKRDGLDIVRRTHAALLPSQKAWNKAVHDGLLPGSAPAPASVTLATLPAFALTESDLAEVGATNGKLELVLAADSKVYDGRFSNNAWLQELPEPLTKQTWGNAVWLSPATAKALGIGDGDLAKVSVSGKELTLPALYVPGQAEGSLRIPLGYGRHFAGHVGGHDDANVTPVGTNAYPLSTTATPFVLAGATIVRVDGRQEIATVQDLHAIDAIGQQGIDERRGLLLAETTLEKFEKEPDFAKHLVHHPPLESMWNDPVAYEGHKWGMAIDLNKCTGCSACITACQAENNIPVVGKDSVLMGREMLWLRVDRYFSGTPENPKLSFQPVPCQQCENAPCEQVCPVGATMHSHEGLNDMVYNRCIGTRYCSANCPYKVRRFNYLNFHLDKVEATPFQSVKDKKKLLMHMVFNPEVTVRARGVMEKCTFCVQRIQNVKIKAKNAKRAIADGEIKTACQETCPSQAISFGDLNDPTSAVAKDHALPRAYTILEELNNRPRVRYLARIRNPHPELG
ncbi:MAG: TAT-variant-translocated molybdopterin oxidoreductase [Polyangiaceae bacterium]|nr:TAT-variant-translocated molybdopterin oxidoreductase [Polyangiaceae bacterium]